MGKFYLFFEKFMGNPLFFDGVIDLNGCFTRFWFSLYIWLTKGGTLNFLIKFHMSNLFLKIEPSLIFWSITCNPSIVRSVAYSIRFYLLNDFLPSKMTLRFYLKAIYLCSASKAVFGRFIWRNISSTLGKIRTHFLSHNTFQITVYHATHSFADRHYLPANPGCKSQTWL